MTEFAVKKVKKAGKTEARTVSITGDMTIINASQARDALLDIFAAEDRICIDLKGVTAVDLTGLQILCAAHRAAISGEKVLMVAGEGNDAFVSAAEAAGLPRHVGCKRDEKKTCIWVGGK